MGGFCITAGSLVSFISNNKDAPNLADYKDVKLYELDLEDFEKLYQQYWEMELDADQFAKNMIAKLVIKLNIPIWFAKGQFGLSYYIEQYPSMSKSVEMSLRSIVSTIQHLKKSGAEYEDIQDHPMVKRVIDKLENFI